MLGVLMSAMDSTIVATVLGTIVADLGGLDKFIWVTASYLVMATSGMLIFGKLSDMYGRKLFYIFGLTIFIIGSILCGTAHSIVQLSVYRAIQGLGSSALMPIALTIVFDIYSHQQGGKIAGFFGAVYGIASVLGPLLGAYITKYFGWHWIFFINLPGGIISFILVYLFYRESHVHPKRTIDWWGACLLAGAVICFMFSLELGGHTYEWTSGIIMGLFIIFVLFFLAFLYTETKATEPIIPYQLFKQRLFFASSNTTFFYGVTFFIIIVYVPIFVQGVLGGSVISAGLFLLPMMLSSVVSSQIGGFLARRMSYRNIMIISGLFLIIGTILLSTMSINTSLFEVALWMTIMGFGIGFGYSVLTMSAIHSSSIWQRGSVNSIIVFLRTFGMTIGITVFGIIQRNIFIKKVTDGGYFLKGLTAVDPHKILSPEIRAQFSASTMEGITRALLVSISQTFIWLLIPVGLAVISIVLMGNERLARHKNETDMSELSRF
jgi:EmrB/QacA subfamily drug resistance transporter